MDRSPCPLECGTWTQVLVPPSWEKGGEAPGLDKPRHGLAEGQPDTFAGAYKIDNPV